MVDAEETGSFMSDYGDFLSKVGDVGLDLGGKFLGGMLDKRYETNSAQAPIVREGERANVRAITPESNISTTSWIPGVSNKLVIIGGAAVLVLFGFAMLRR